MAIPRFALKCIAR